MPFNSLSYRAALNAMASVHNCHDEVRNYGIPAILT